VEADAVGGWGDDLDIEDAANDDADYASSNLKADGAVSCTYKVPVAGICPGNRWCKNSAHAADHAAAGSFGSSMNFLNRQISIVNFSPMQGRFLLLHAASKSSVPGLPLSLSYEIAMLRDGNVANDSCFPRIANSMPQLINALRNSYRLFQKGNFQASKDIFHHILLCIPLIIAESRSHANEVGSSSLLLYLTFTGA
jgi:coatomer protein complex subunit alpha (xenin)